MTRGKLNASEKMAILIAISNGEISVSVCSE